MHKLSTIRLVRVQFVPRHLEPGNLYVSEEYEAAVHLCACGCGNKVSTPLCPTEWSFLDALEGPTLEPSVGNWEFPCRSHYWIKGGQVVWSDDWSSVRVEEGRRAEEARRRKYYDTLKRQRRGLLRKLWDWMKRLFGL